MCKRGCPTDAGWPEGSQLPSPRLAHLLPPLPFLPLPLSLPPRPSLLSPGGRPPVAHFASSSSPFLPLPLSLPPPPSPLLRRPDPRTGGRIHAPAAGSAHGRPDPRTGGRIRARAVGFARGFPMVARSGVSLCLFVSGCSSQIVFYCSSRCDDGSCLSLISFPVHPDRRCISCMFCAAMIVEIIDVDFAYPSRPHMIIFNGLSLSIQSGKSTALVGKSGSGKSTIIGLIERFYDPHMGVVKIDNRDIKSYDLRALRQQIGLVNQEPTLFGGTIKENIMYGTETTSEVEIENAARSANAHDFISSLKDGYNTWCGERGFQLSGGQKQRIAIARAILKNPAILLLDEATSALDNASEKAVQEALDQVMIGRTSIVVAHRLSTIQNCDIITVLEGGVVVEEGTHISLMAKGPSGRYFELVNLHQGVNQHSDSA
ncbi:hypothetical protein ACP70R_026857 [Stipagrostis hirtigluma subsp. patula]